jgi:Uma2 family endonuclease
VSPIGNRHALITAKLLKLLILESQHLDVVVMCQSTIRMGDRSMPEPDIAVVPAQDDFTRPIGGLLIVEVADSSLRIDSTAKQEIYANAKVPEYWIIDESPGVSSSQAEHRQTSANAQDPLIRSSVRRGSSG